MMSIDNIVWEQTSKILPCFGEQIFKLKQPSFLDKDWFVTHVLKIG